MTPELARSYRYCENLARREAGNFYPAFRVLPRQQRLATCALYAFMRIADDLSDEPAPLELKRRRLAQWRRGLEEVCHGHCSHISHSALLDTLTRYDVPPAYLEAVLDGVEMDLAPVAFATFEQLRVYCYRVASAVGLACIHIWGFQGQEAKVYAEAAGLAFQLTNILRDLGEDAERGRVYLPQEDLDRFGYAQEKLLRGERDGAFQDLMRFEVERARKFYDSAWPLAPRLSAPGRAVFLAMARTYHGLLEEIESRDYDVFTSRIRISPWRKLLFTVQALPARWGWV